MKTILYKISMFLFILAQISCSKEQDEKKEPIVNDLPIEFCSSKEKTNVLSRSSLSESGGRLFVNWEISDEVGVFAVSTDAANHITELGRNFKYQAIPDNTATKCAFSSAGDNVLRWKFNQSHSFYAYHPFTGKNGVGTASSFPIILPKSQIQDKYDDRSHLTDLMFMKANPVLRDNGDQDPVNFSFYNVFSVVELKIKTEEGASEFVLNRIQAMSTDRYLSVSSGSVDLTTSLEDDQVQTPLFNIQGVKSVSLEFAENPTLNTIEKSFYLVLAPGLHPASSVKFELFEENGGKASIAIEEALRFKSNVCHARTLTIKDDNFVMPEDAQKVTVKSDTDVKYVLGNLASSSLYSDREGYLAIDLPSKFSSWDIATTGIKTRLNGSITPVAKGKVYIITRINRSGVMSSAGWTPETPATDDEAVAWEKSNGNPKLVVWYKQAEKGESIVIPGSLSDKMFGGYIPIAPSIIIE